MKTESECIITVEHRFPEAHDRTASFPANLLLKRFRICDLNLNMPLSSFLWHIPLTYKTNGSSLIHRHLMTTHTGRNFTKIQNVLLFYRFFFKPLMLSIVLFAWFSDSIHVGEEVSWVKVNTDMTGYYLVHYEDGGWDNMIDLLRENHTALSYKDRTHLIHNAFQLVT